MNLSEQYLKMHETVQTVTLEGKEYQIEIQKAIQALIEYEMENPDMGNSDDFKDDAERRRRLTKQLKGLDAETVKEQIEMYVGDDEMSVKQLLKDKVIK